MKKLFTFLTLVLASANVFGDAPACPTEVNDPKYFLVQVVNANAGTDCTTLTTQIREHSTANLGATSTVTISIASPAVITWTAHPLFQGNKVVFTTTGTLPTGIVAGEEYFVIAAGLTADTFEISHTSQFGGAINTSGSQSGVQTAEKLGLFDTVFQLDAPTQGTAALDISTEVANGCASDDNNVPDTLEFPAANVYNGFLGVAVNNSRTVPARILPSAYFNGPTPAHGEHYNTIRFLTDGVNPKTKVCQVTGSDYIVRYFCRVCGKISQN